MAEGRPDGFEYNLVSVGGQASFNGVSFSYADRWSINLTNGLDGVVLKTYDGISPNPANSVTLFNGVYLGDGQFHALLPEKWYYLGVSLSGKDVCTATLYDTYRGVWNTYSGVLPNKVWNVDGPLSYFGIGGSFDRSTGDPLGDFVGNIDEVVIANYPLPNEDYAEIYAFNFNTHTSLKTGTFVIGAGLLDNAVTTTTDGECRIIATDCSPLADVDIDDMPESLVELDGAPDGSVDLDDSPISTLTCSVTR